MKKTIQAIITFLLIAGILILCIMGLNVGLTYAQSKQVDIYIGKTFDTQEIEQIVKEVTNESFVVIQKVELYEDMVSITTKELSQEQLEAINQKINEKYSIENKIEDLTIVDNAKIRGRDVIKPYILPILITLVIIAIYAAIRYRKLGIGKTILKVIGYPILAQAVLLSLIGITRIPVTYVTISIVLAVYAISYMVVFAGLEKKEKMNKENKEEKEMKK
ncbi:MAG: hypothetical protein ACLU84_01010 [Clostridia bacterium]